MITRAAANAHWPFVLEAQRRNKGYVYFDATGFLCMGVDMIIERDSR